MLPAPGSFHSGTPLRRGSVADRRSTFVAVTRSRRHLRTARECGKPRVCRRRTSSSSYGKIDPIAKNVLARDRTCTRPNETWVGDITYVWTREGWLYLAVLIDLFFAPRRRVVDGRDACDGVAAARAHDGARHATAASIVPGLRRHDKATTLLAAQITLLHESGDTLAAHVLARVAQVVVGRRWYHRRTVLVSRAMRPPRPSQLGRGLSQDPTMAACGTTDTLRLAELTRRSPARRTLDRSQSSLLCPSAITPPRSALSRSTN